MAQCENEINSGSVIPTKEESRGVTIEFVRNSDEGLNGNHSSVER